MKAPIVKSALLIAVTSFFFSCQKDVSSELATDNPLASKAAVTKNNPKERELTGKMSTYTFLVPDFDNGWEYPNPVPAWYPGRGEGTMSHIGKFTTVFNQYAYQVEGEGAAGITFKLTDEAKAELAMYGIIGVPDDIGTVIFDKQGNSIWSKGTYTYIIEEDYPGRFLVYGVMNIVDGTGKYEGATGHLVLNGYSDIVPNAGQGEPNTIDWFEISGHIVY